MHEPALIVGAGPVGLGAALFLARQGRIPRVVEKRLEPTVHSKALALNPRTLDILEPTGVTKELLELGAPVRGARFTRAGKLVASVSFARVHPRYPFMLALSQATTERVLAGALEAAGGTIERGTELIACGPAGGGVEAALERVQQTGRTRELAYFRYLLAADGAHSTARGQMAVEFPGGAFRHEWHLADVVLRTDLAHDHAHVVFQPGGAFQFLLPVVDGPPAVAGADRVWRVMTNRPDPLARLERAEAIGAPLWTSTFRIAHRLAAPLSRSSVYFAGDAAHVHSPVGARGLNLGLEDAWVFAELVRTGRLPDYERLRLPVDRSVVRRVELISKVASAETWLHLLVRSFVLPLVVKLPLVRGRIAAAVTGLDHPLPVL